MSGRRPQLRIAVLAGLPARAIAFAAGIWLLQQRPDLPAAPGLYLLPFALLAAVLFVRPDGHRYRVIRTLAVLILCVTIGHLHAAVRAHWRLSDHLSDRIEGRDIRVVGVIAEMPQASERGERFVDGLLGAAGEVLERGSVHDGMRREQFDDRSRHLIDDDWRDALGGFVEQDA